MLGHFGITTLSLVYGYKLRCITIKEYSHSTVYTLFWCCALRLIERFCHWILCHFVENCDILLRVSGTRNLKDEK